jgi:hypothetical protein
MNQANFFKAAVPDPWTILGLDLKPLSAGHLLLLGRIESPLVGASESEPEWMDLAFAVAICSKDLDGGIELLNHEGLSEEIGAWLSRIASERGELVLQDEISKFLEYMRAGCSAPDYICKESGSDIGDIPSVQFVKSFLISNTTLTVKEFWNQPWALSIWDFLTIQAQKGHIQLCSGGAIAEAEAMGAKLARLMKEGKIKCPS